MTIAPITISSETLQQVSGGRAGPGGSLGDRFMEFLEEANSEIRAGEAAAVELAAGRSNNIHEVMVAMERASITLHLVGSVRNRLLEAYNETMRMGM